MIVVSQRDVEIIRRGYAAFLEGDVEAAFGVFADDTCGTCKTGRR
jgi:hypothetical protein